MDGTITQVVGGEGKEKGPWPSVACSSEFTLQEEEERVLGMKLNM